MEQRRFGLTQREVAVVGQGTWYIDDGPRAVAIATLRAGLDLGMTHIDTAEMYGEAELLVAEAIRGRRDEVFLVDKVVPRNASASGTLRACERSLQRLRRRSSATTIALVRAVLPTAVHDDRPGISLEGKGGTMARESAGEVGVTTWQLDPAHSAVEFSVKHMMMTTVRGRFKELEATLTGDRDHPEHAGVEATIVAASIDTGVADRDAHLRSSDFFDAEQHPHITFRSKRIGGDPPEQTGDRFHLVGDLTIRDTTMEVVLDCEYEGRGTDPWGKTRAGFTFRTELDRKDWGLRWNQALETGGVLVANKVRVEAELQFVRQGD